MATTKYTVNTVDAEGVATPALEGKTFSKRATAVTAAQELRDELKLAVQVVTDKGTVSFEQAAPKKINMSPQYTRTVELPEGVVAPEGKRVAYSRPRAGLALLHDPNAEKGKQYTIFNLKTGKESRGTFPTTRAGGIRMTEIAQKAAQAGQETPAPKPETSPEAPVDNPAELASA